MNQSKIAAYYEAAGYANLELLKAAAGYQPEYNTLAFRLGCLLGDEGQEMAHLASIKNFDAPSTQDEYVVKIHAMPKRVYEWAMKQAPADSIDTSYRANRAAGLDTYAIH